LQSELKSRRARIQYHEQTKAHAEAALRAMRTPEMVLSASFLVDTCQASQRWTYVPQRTTYDELVAAGIADSIPNVEIRSRLANLYVGLESSNITQQEPMPFRDEIRRQMPHDVQRAIRDRCNDIYTFLNGLVYLELPETCEVGLDENLIADAVDALGACDALGKDLTRHISILDSKLNSLRAWELPLRETIDVLKRE
jgi:hypothetical protein